VTIRELPMGPFKPVKDSTMGLDTDQFDFFVSYARKDNENGWITAFVKKLLEEHRTFSGGRDLKPFFDHESIRSFDDWEHRIYEALSNSRMFLAFLSPNYLASESSVQKFL
jgi:hypothetical protein